MSLLRRTSKESSGVSLEKDSGETVAESPVVVGKGRPTPKRRDAQGVRRGPVAPPPRTQREAIKRSREGGKKLTKDERRALAAERRQRMAKGDPAFLMARDKGEIRAFVRDQVDLRRNLAGLLMPLAIVSFVILLVPNAYVQTFGPMVLLIAILAALADGIIFGRKLGRLVRAQFPKGDSTSLSRTGRALGFYAFNRAIMPRRWRVPKPRVQRG